MHKITWQKFISIRRFILLLMIAYAFFSLGTLLHTAFADSEPSALNNVSIDILSEEAEWYGVGENVHLRLFRDREVNETANVTLTSETGGEFGPANLSECTGGGSFELQTVTISSNSNQRAFCYRNENIGTDTITAVFSTNTGETATATLSIRVGEIVETEESDTEPEPYPNEDEGQTPALPDEGDEEEVEDEIGGETKVEINYYCRATNDRNRPFERVRTDQRMATSLSQRTTPHRLDIVFSERESSRQNLDERYLINGQLMTGYDILLDGCRVTRLPQYRMR